MTKSNIDLFGGNEDQALSSVLFIKNDGLKIIYFYCYRKFAAEIKVVLLAEINSKLI